MIKRKAIFHFSCAALLLLSGCAKAFETSRGDARRAYKRLSSSILTSNEPRRGTQQYLRIRFLDQKFKEDPLAVIEQLQEEVQQKHSQELEMTITELIFLSARRTEKFDPKAAMEIYLVAAANSYDFILRDGEPERSWGLTPSRRFFTMLYNASISKFVLLWQANGNTWDQELEHCVFEVCYKTSVSVPGEEYLDPREFDRFRSSYQIDVKGLRNHYRQLGVGAALVGIWDNDSKKPNYDPSRVEPRAFAPATAALFFSDPKSNSSPLRIVDLRFFDPFYRDVMLSEDGSYSIPLEADFTTPLIMFLEDAQKQKKASPFKAALSSDKFVDDIQLKRLGRHYPHKIPVLVVHGLFSEPETFVELINDIKGVEELRDKYQFWYFKYPTGLPIMYSAFRLRDEFAKEQKKIDPQNINKNYNQVIVIGHSMGGLLTKSLVQTTGADMWNSFFTVGPEELEYSDEADEKQLLKNLVFYESVPDVTRVIFIATPHRGSDIATNFIGRLGARLISLPKRLVNFTRGVVTLNRDKMKISQEYLMASHMTSIDQLRPDSPYLQATDKLKIEVPHHSIIGIQKSGKPGPGSSDEVVAYESSHLDTAESEIFVPEWHSCVGHPLTISEVKRILLLHLDELKATGSGAN